MSCRTPNIESRDYQIGAIRIRVSSSITELLEEHRSLYKDFATEDKGEAPIHITIEPEKASLFQRRRYIIRVNNDIQYEPARYDQVLPYVEWAMNFQIPQRYHTYLQFHASSLSRHGLGLIMPGQSGSGKSTLTAALLHHGWDYLCDEFALIHHQTMQMHPYPRAVCIKKPSYEPLQDYGLSVSNTRYYFKGSKGYVTFINPHRIRQNAIGRACPPRFLVFPTYRDNQHPSLEPISRSEAAFELHRHCFNLLNCSRPGLDIIAGFIAQTECYRLNAGPLHETVPLLDEMADKAQNTWAQTA
ncbi:MAG: hypothetical protein ACPGXK_09775 [Phycisphaerae bacterium]